MRFLFVMDPMDRILPDKDTTFAFQRAAGQRNHESFHALVNEVFVREGRAFAQCRTVSVSDDAPHVTQGTTTTLALEDFDAIFIRKDPPFDAAYLYLTHILELVRGKTLLFNDPRGLRDANEKLYALHFSKWTPRTLVSSSSDVLFAFLKDIGGKGVIKPLDGAGGSGVMMLAEGDQNMRAIVETLTLEGRRLAMLQEYLPAVRKGDKRVLLLDGNVLGGINRVPRADDLRSNIHVGGSVEPTEVTAEERVLIEDIAPRLRADGLFFVGLDLIGGKLTEVNVTSPTGIQEMSRFANRDLAVEVIAWVETKAKATR